MYRFQQRQLFGTILLFWILIFEKENFYKWCEESHKWKKNDTDCITTNGLYNQFF